MKERLLTVRDVSNILNLSEKEVIELANANLIPHFKIDETFLRFKKSDILRIKEEINKKYNFQPKKQNKIEKIKDFFYFNDFYIFSTLIILLLLWIIFK